MTVMPAAFIGHGSPMNALESNRYTGSWRALGAALPRPRAVLVVSAHWYINATAVTAMPRPRTIHDFFGFPQDLFALDYPAPGAPDVAAEVEEIAKPTWVGQDVDSWGLDHGTWSVLTHMFPDADVPVVQLSIDATKPFDRHLELGAKLAPLRESGVMIVGSGNVVHNLGGIDPRRPDEGFDWAHRFDDAARATMTGSPDTLPSIQCAPDFDAAVPTADHFIPLLYLAGLGAAAGRGADVLVDGYAYGSLSMTAYTLDLPAPVAVPAGRPPEEMTT
ncbi:4,5-DOPA dioxygenase extradiol [Pseudonocardia sp.]|uniref:4,5-DOPA-extradiol-dioxygenase n=1 Tax=Pseudonocardia sp. TaxID=60912 RepID=UPI00263610DC|nr:4,5-DOPA dioxygenase extradiol [Pseudonocardia sp.]